MRSRADLAQGLFWVAVGAAIVYGSWTMDRLAQLGVPPFAAPGLLPGIVGAFIVLLGLAMAARRRAAAPAQAPSLRASLLPLALCLAFAGGLVGRGMPFWLAASLFVAVTIAVLKWREAAKPRLLASAAAIGLAAGLVVSTLFQQVFLIRLP